MDSRQEGDWLKIAMLLGGQAQMLARPMDFRQGKPGHIEGAQFSAFTKNLDPIAAA